jgi:hypothetical protein
MFATLFVMGMPALFPAQAGSGGGCACGGIRPGGPAVEKRLFAAPLQRVREALEDAMQAGGVLLLESTSGVVRGERVRRRVKALNLPAGDERVIGHLEAIARDGKAGTFVQVETKGRGKNGAPKQSWSAGILEETDCILKALGTGDPVAPAMELPSTTGRKDQLEAVLAGETAVVLILSRFALSGDLKLNQRLVFEVADDVTTGSRVVIRKGAPGVARVKALEYVKGIWAAKMLIEFESVQTVSGNRIPLHGVVDTAGRIGSQRSLHDILLGDEDIPAGEFALCAGTRFEARVEGEQRVHLGR